MEILKYLDVLIGLAVVMLLLSPLVTAFTQLCLWLFRCRAGRLKVGLTNMVLELNRGTFQRFDQAEVTGLAPGTAVTFQQPDPLPSITRTANADGVAVLVENVPYLLTATGGDISKAISSPLPAGAAIRLIARGSGAGWTVTSPATDDHGQATIAYRFTGSPEFATNTATIGGLNGASLSVTIASGEHQGETLIVDGDRLSYPPSISPIPAQHDLTLKLTSGGSPVAGSRIALTFHRSPAAEQANPLPLIKPPQARQIAEHILLHRMVAQPAFLANGAPGKGHVVTREDLIHILLDLAADAVDMHGCAGRKESGAQAANMPKAQQDAAVIADSLCNLRSALLHNGIANPAASLAAIRDTVQKLEATDAAAAAHDRMAHAILTASQSAFVGRITTWFDHTMDRTTADFKFRAQLLTALGALVVATVVQLDSIDLLRRLSADDKLRASLVQQAENQQKHIEEQQQRLQEQQQSASAPSNAQAQTPVQTAIVDPADIEAAKARRDEIEANLATLRDPQLAVLPDHFIWQPLPRAHLDLNTTWPNPLPKLELAVGGAIYPLDPQLAAAAQSGDALDAIATSIRASKAPVTVEIEKRKWNVNAAKNPNGRALVLTSGHLGGLQLRWKSGKPETNILDASKESSGLGFIAFDSDLFTRCWRGILLTWLLLSLGAPFWYDALKDLLKFRSGMARKEEDQRTDRQNDTSKKQPATAK